MRLLKHALAKIFVCSRMLMALLYLQTLVNNSAWECVNAEQLYQKILVYFGLYHHAPVESGTNSSLLLKV